MKPRGFLQKGLGGSLEAPCGRISLSGQVLFAFWVGSRSSTCFGAVATPFGAVATRFDASATFLLAPWLHFWATGLKKDWLD